MTGLEVIEQARINELIGIPYNKCDCQGLIEKILKRAGVSSYNYRGSNHMWRELCSDRWKNGERVLLPGDLLFTVKDDGGEKAKGYHDNMGNAVHIGMYVGYGYPGTVIHSTTGGVQWGNHFEPRWTHAAECKCYARYIDTTEYDTATVKAEIIEQINCIRDMLVTIETEVLKSEL